MIHTLIGEEGWVFGHCIHSLSSSNYLYLTILLSISLYPFPHDLYVYVSICLSFYLLLPLWAHTKYIIIHTHTQVHTFALIYKHKFALIHKHIRAHIQTHMHSYSYANTFALYMQTLLFALTHTFVFIRKHAHSHSWINTHSHSYTHAFALVQTLRHKRFRTRVTICSRQENTPFITCNDVKSLVIAVNVFLSNAKVKEWVLHIYLVGFLTTAERVKLNLLVVEYEIWYRPCLQNNVAFLQL